MTSKRLAPVLACALTLSAASASALPASAAGPASGGLSAPAADDGLSLDAGSAFAGRDARLSGTVPERDAGRPVTIQRRDGQGAWTTIATTTAHSDGTFATTWTTERAGAFTVRAVPGGAAAVRAAQDEPAAGEPGTDRLLVYRTALSTWYGSAMYGRRTACGQTLSASLIGVAHKTLPCGTRIAFYYHGRTVVAPVIDRGPYAGNRSFDLTYAAAKRLDMLADGVGRVGWVSLGR